MQKSRLYYSLKNTVFGILTQTVTLILTFTNRSLFIRFLTVEYLGCNGLFSNILSMLSLAELGIGPAIVYSLYKPIADNNKQKIQAYMNAYKKAYFVIAGVIAIAGLCLIPILPYIIDNTTNIAVGELRIIYVLFLSNTVLSYFFTYKRSLLSASQHEYINSLNTTKFNIIRNILQIILLYFTRSYYAYLLAMILCTVLSNISVSRKCDKLFPYINGNKEKLHRKEKKQLYKYVLAQTSHKVGGIVVSSTDNLLITLLVKNGIYLVGLYSNYLMIISAVKGILTTIFNSLTGSIGNLNTENNIQRRKKVFDDIFFLSCFFYGVSGICIMCLIQDFIKLWLGDIYLLNTGVILIVIINYFVTGLRTPCQLYNTTLGLFWNDRFKPWIEAAINLIASVILIHFYGLIGVFLGTLISTMTTSFWVEPYLLYKYGFQMKLRNYFFNYGKYILETIIIGTVLYTFSQKIICINWVIWIAKAFGITFISCLLFILFNIKRPEMKDLIIRIKNLFGARSS